MKTSSCDLAPQRRYLCGEMIVEPPPNIALERTTPSLREDRALLDQSSASTEQSLRRRSIQR